jgi:hypothetical protein
VTPHPSHDLGIWVEALLTLAILSLLYRENPLYRFAEHLFVGVSTGTFVIQGYWMVIHPHLVLPLVLAFHGRGVNPAHRGFLAVEQGDYRGLLLVPALLGLLLLTRLAGPGGRLSRAALAVVLGVFAGIRMTGFAQADLVAQVEASLRPMWRAGQLGYSLGAIVFLLGLVTSLLFFLLGRRRQGAAGITARVGSCFLMIAFGAGFGYAVMSRISVLIGRFEFLIGTWLGLH